jgi:hypothetical protein
MADEIIVSDLRDASDPSLAIVPRLTNWDQVMQYFGLRRLENYGWAATPVGQTCWKLVEVYVRSGVAAYIPKARGEGGQPYENALLVRTWPGAPDLEAPTPLCPDYNRVLGAGFIEHHATVGFTNAEGDAGFAYGSGSVSGPDGGPDAIWVHVPVDGVTPPQHSDCLAGLGWIGGTNHLTANPIFQEMRKPGDVPPPATDGAEYLVDLDAAGNIVQHIAWTVGPPPAGTAALGLWRGGQVVAYAAWQPGAPPQSLMAELLETQPRSVLARLLGRR